MSTKKYKKIDHETMKEIADIVIEKYKEEVERAKKTKFDKRLRNTKLLLRNFRELSQHSDSAIYEAAQVQDESLAEILEMMSGNFSGDNELYIDSIKKSSARTGIIIEHVREMMMLYESYCDRSQKPEDKRRYRTVNSLYIDETPKNVQQIAREEAIDERTVYKDVDAACEKLSALIFGVEWLNR